jgi:hypothetical protein
MFVLPKTAFQIKIDGIPIKTNLIGYINHLTIFSYERVLTKNISVMGTYGKGKYLITGTKAEDNLGDKLGRSFPCTQEVNLKSYFSIEARYYLSYNRYKIPAGFHIGPSINFFNGSEIFTSTQDVTGYFTNYGTQTVTTNYKNISFLVNIGPQLLIKRLIALDISVGLGFGRTSGTERNVYGTSQQFGSSSDFSYGGFVIAFSTSIGIAFGK